MTDFIITPDNQGPREQALRFIAGLSDRQKWVVEVKRYVKKRTLSQNNLMWMWLEHAAKAAGDEHGADKEVMHQMFKQRFLTPVHTFEHDGEVFGVYSTKGLSTIEMRDYMEQISRFCAQELGVHVPIPEEFYR